jgi:hypothetical protein
LRRSWIFRIGAPGLIGSLLVLEPSGTADQSISLKRTQRLK